MREFTGASSQSRASQSRVACHSRALFPIRSSVGMLTPDSLMECMSMPALPSMKGLRKWETPMEIAKIRLAQMERESMAKEMRAADFRRELGAVEQQ